jgi:hypothetical protein
MARIDRFSRRTLLRALGLGPAVLPLLDMERAHGQVPAAKCALIVAWANGMLSESSASGWPAPGENFAFKPFQASLEPLRSDLILLDNMNYRFLRDSKAPEFTGHACFQGMLTGAVFQAPGTGTSSIVAGGPSIDQHIGSSLVKAGYQGIPSLNLGVLIKSPGRLSWRGAGDPIVPVTDPYRVFEQVFGAPTSGGGGEPDPAVERRRAMKKSILDNVIKDLNRFSGRVGTEDRVKIEAHLQSIRELEAELDRMGGGTAGGEPPVLPEDVNTASTENFEATTKMMIDISVAAMAADATRVVVLQLGDQGDSDLILYSLGFKPGGKDGNTGNVNGYHSIAHRNGAEKDKMDTWFQSQLAYAMTSMKSAGLLDRGVFLAMNNMRHGMHEFNNVPAILAGNAGGYFKTGRSIKLPDNTANNGILVAVANALGVPTETFGNAAYGGELSVLRG